MGVRAAGSLLMALVCATAMADPSGPAFPRIANCYAAGLKPDSQAKDIEEIARFDLLIGGVWCNWNDPVQRAKLAENTGAVRKQNPHIIMLDFSSSAPYADSKDAAFPPNGWLLQPDGKRILGWPGTEMINLLKPEVIDWLAGRSAASVRDKGFDGSFIDCMGGGFDWWACNIEHREPYQVDADGDGKPDDRKRLDAAWLQAKTELSRKVRESLGPKPVFMTNGAGEWGLPDMNGILLEDRLDYVLEGRGRWDDVVSEYIRWTESGLQPNVTTIVSSSGIEPPYEAWKAMSAKERDALLERGRNRMDRMRFGLATTLMGDGYYAYDLHTRWRGQRWWYPEYDAPLGYPKGKAQRRPDGTWRREFDGGAVIVNPTFFDAEARFEERRRDASSGKVSRQFIIPAQDGRILLRSDEPEAAGTIPDPHPLFTASGPDQVLQRPGCVLVRFKGGAWLFEGNGRLLAVSDGARTLLDRGGATIVKTPWKDFEYADCRHEVMPDGRVRFTGYRASEGVRLAYQQDVAFKEDALEVAWHWEAMNDAEFQMIRHSLDFPVSEYANAGYKADEAEGNLPPERAPRPWIAGPFGAVTVTPAKGPAIRVELSQDGMLIDERHYGVSCYRVSSFRSARKIKAGETWSVVFRMSIAKPAGRPE